jgi:hypothetical protein
MKKKIELNIEHKDNITVELTNDKGDTFTYNPLKHEGLEDFLNGVKILSSTRDWSLVSHHNRIDYQQASENNCWLKFDDGSECKYDDDWPFASVTHYSNT